MVPRVCLPVVLAVFIAGCSVVSGKLAVTPEGGLAGGVKVVAPGTDKVIVAADGEMDVMSALVELYKVAKGKLFADDEPASVE